MSREHGFSLVELMVVILVIAILLAIAVPTYLGARHRAQDRAAQQYLTNGAKAELSYESDGAGFITSVALLAAEDPSADWSGATPGSLHVVVGDVQPGDSEQLLLYTQSGSATWFGLRLVEVGPAAGRHTCRGTLAADVDALTDGVGVDW